VTTQIINRSDGFIGTIGPSFGKPTDAAIPREVQLGLRVRVTF
jgi:hypothetical protein